MSSIGLAVIDTDYLQTFHASCLIRQSSFAAQPQMSRITLSTTREPSRSSFIGSSRMYARLWRTAPLSLHRTDHE